MTSSCLRVREGGEVLERIDTLRPAFACVLGGDDGRTLYICTANDYDRERRRADPSGSIDALRVAVPAAADPA
jgi:sugar lactone lactonase YvrE